MSRGIEATIRRPRFLIHSFAATRPSSRSRPAPLRPDNPVEEELERPVRLRAERDLGAEQEQLALADRGFNHGHPVRGSPDRTPSRCAAASRCRTTQPAARPSAPRPAEREDRAVVEEDVDVDRRIRARSAPSCRPPPAGSIPARRTSLPAADAHRRPAIARRGDSRSAAEELREVRRRSADSEDRSAILEELLQLRQRLCRRVGAQHVLILRRDVRLAVASGRRRAASPRRHRRGRPPAAAPGSPRPTEG